MARKTIRRLIERPLGSEWQRLVRRIEKRRARRFLLFWNRGLGDIALGLCRVIDEFRRHALDAEINVVTRTDLADAFALLPVDTVIVDRGMVRSEAVDAVAVCRRLGIDPGAYDIVLPRPDPTHWFRGEPARVPHLHWPVRCDALVERYATLFGGGNESTIDIGVHVQSETGTYYRYRKDWPIDSWHACFRQLQQRHPVRFILLGHGADHRFDDIRCVDLRGQTSFLEMMSVIRQRCRVLIAPDSGVLTMTYYLDVQTPIEVLSLWADPRQGVLKQGVPSPNRLLRHRPLLAPGEQIEHLGIGTVVAAVGDVVDSLLRPALDARSSFSAAPAHSP